MGRQQDPLGGPSAVVAGPNPAPVDETLPALVADRAAKDPDHPAVVVGDDVLTYAELDVESSRVAHELASRDVGPGSVVGVIGHRRPSTVVAILGALKSGAAYVAIDPGYPDERIDQMVDDAGLDVILTDREGDTGSARTGRRVLALDRSALDTRPATPPDVAVGPDDLAYLIYTSGSTGRPKAVMVRHRNIVASTAARSEVYPGGVGRFLLLSSFSFDSSMVGLFWSLTTGATLVMPPEGRHDDVLEIAALIERQRITHLLALPTLYRLLVTEAAAGQLRSLRTVIVAGESCSYDVVERHRLACPDALLANEYGPSEGTVWSHVYLVEPSLDRDPVPIGSPIPGVAHIVLDAAGRAVADGAPGELLISGSGIAAGYHGRPDLTAERFVELDVDTRHPGPWYRTGDRVRADDRGRLLFVGRVDDQIKVRGVRVEPAEVEAALRSCGGIRDAAVGLSRIAGREQLVAWCVPTGDLDTGGVRAELADLVPDQLVPTRFVAVDALPLGPNGKVDRRALLVPEPDEAVRPTPQPPEPESSGDRRVDLLAGIWAEVLGLDRVAPDDNFFDLGGDSIISLQIVVRARRRGLDLRPRQLFEHQTVSELAAAAIDLDVATERPSAVGDVPLTPIQRWFVDQGHEWADHWNQTLDLGVDPDTDLDALFEALDDVRMRHEQLRCRFELATTTPRQEIMDDPAPVVRHEVDLETAPRWDDAVAELETSLDLSAGRSVGVLVGHRSGRPDRLVVTIHHLVVDGVSWSTIVEDWAAAYAARAAGRTPALPDRSASFQQWAHTLQSAANDDRYGTGRPSWRTEAHTPDSEFELRRSPANSEGAALTERRSVDRATTERLLSLGGGGETAPSVEDVLLAALARTVSARRGGGRVAVTLEGHGREEVGDPPVDVSRTVGWFTTMFPVVLDVDPSGDPAAAIRTVSEQLRSIPDRGIGYGIDRYLRADDSVDRELPVVAFNYLGQLDRVVRAAAPFTVVGELSGSNAPGNRRGQLLGVLAVVRDGSLSILVEHLPEHISAAAAAALADDLTADIRRLVDAAADVAPATPSFDLLDQSDADAAQLGALLDQFD